MDKEKKAATGITAHMIAFDDQHRELVFPVDSGDLQGEGPAPAPRGPYRSGGLQAAVRGEVQIRQANLFTHEPPAIVAAGGMVTESGTAKAYVIAADLNPTHADTP